MINWIITHQLDIFHAVTATIAAFAAIAALTPTPKDDTWAGKLYKIVDWLALNVGKAKDK